MREWMNIVEGKAKLRPTAADIAWIRNLRHQIRTEEGGGGMCHFVSEVIYNKFGWQQESGSYLAPNGDVICGGGHLWNVLPDGAILDATADQFGEGQDIRIIEPDDPDYHRYSAEWYSDYHPGMPEYDWNWRSGGRKPEHWTGEMDADQQNRLSKERGHYWWLNDLTHKQAYSDLDDKYSGRRDPYRDEMEKSWKDRRK